MEQLSVVIPVFNNWWLTARCLRVLEGLRAEIALSFETIVVDNGSSDETPETIAEFPAVRYVRFEENRNFAGACNAGVAAAQAPLTLLLNNDAYPLGDALTPLVRAFERPEVAIAGGALFFEDGLTQAAGLVVLPNDHWHYFCRNLTPSLDDVGKSRDALGVSGAAMTVRNEWFLQGGGFDEGFINGFEDVDLCMRAREQGRSIAYVSESRFAHYEAASAGRFDREAQNERRYYERWRPRMSLLPRTARGSVGAIQVRDDGGNSLFSAALQDLEAALRGFGHPVTHQRITPWQRLDRRFRHAASLSWFCGASAAPGVTIARAANGSAAIRTHGAIELDVPWLPCVAPERAGTSRVVASTDPSCATIGVIGDAPLDLGSEALRITPELLLGAGERVEVACVVHCGLSDDAGFGNVLLAQAAIPAVVLDCDELRHVFAPDVAIVTDRDGLSDAIARLLADPRLRERYAQLVAADSRRRFSPRRTAIRVVDLLCAARFGLERPVAAAAGRLDR